jgi:hypothetical protein
VTLITQRSAAINKNVLTQVQTLIAMRTTGPQDRAAVEEWLKYNHQEQRILESLPSLKDGEAWVWSPHFLGKTVKIRFRLRETFDSGATPKVAGTARPAATLADVDLGAIRGRMAATIEKAKAEDPRDLRRQLVEVRAELTKVRAAPTPSTNEMRVEVPVLKDADIRRLEATARRVESFNERTLKAMQEMAKAADGLLLAARSASTPPPYVSPTMGRVHEQRRTGSPKPMRVMVSRSSPAEGLTEPQQRILDTVAMLNVRGIEVDRDAVARWLGLHPNGGSYGANLGLLRSADYLDRFVLTDLGQRTARPQETGLEAALRALDGEPKRQIVRVLVNAGHPMSREDLAAKLGLHPNGGSYGANLGWLRTMGLLTKRVD